MSNLPSELFREILIWLPAKSLLRFRGVCKEWRRLIDDPSFTKSYTNHELSSNTLLITNARGALSSVPLDSLNFTDKHQRIFATRVRKPTIHGGYVYPILQQCDGLILVSYLSILNGAWVIWNPSTGEIHTLPRPPRTDIPMQSSGFGYDSAADDFKVVRMDHTLLDGVNLNQTQIYSLKSNSWRTIGDCPYTVWKVSDAVYLCGALHWISAEGVIFSLDLGTEDYHHLSLPFTPTTEEPLGMRLSSLGGCLFLGYKRNRYDGWVMNEYGVESSWTKLFSFEEPRLIDTRAVAYFKSKKHVLLEYTKGFFLVDIESYSVKKVKINGISDIFCSQICPRSLFRLRSLGNSRTEKEEN